MSATTADDAPTLARLDGALRALGYTPGEPARLRAAIAIGRAVAHHATCPGCGWPGLHLAAYHRPGGYCAVAHCPACGFAFEM